MFTDADLIFSYTRAQAIQDGLLVDVTERAREAGFRIPVAVTAAVWAESVEWPETEPAIQDESGRLWNLVFMAAMAAWQAALRAHADPVSFELEVVPHGGEVAALMELVLHIGPGDQGEPVVTIMEPGD